MISAMMMMTKTMHMNGDCDYDDESEYEGSNNGDDAHRPQLLVCLHGVKA